MIVTLDISILVSKNSNFIYQISIRCIWNNALNEGSRAFFKSPIYKAENNKENK